MNEKSIFRVTSAMGQSSASPATAWRTWTLPLVQAALASIIPYAVASKVFIPIRSWIGSVISVGPLTQRPGDVALIAFTAGVTTLVACGLLAALCFPRWWASRVTSLWHVIVAAVCSSFVTLCVFVATTIPFDATYFSALFAATVLANVMAIVALRWICTASSDVQDGSGFVAPLLSSPAFYLCSAIIISPWALMCLYKVDERIANSINNLRVYLIASESSLEYKLVDFFPDHSFSHPIAVCQSPYRESTYYVLERSGLITRIVRENGQVKSREVVLDFTGEVNEEVENGALGMDLHPNFNRPGTSGSDFVYVYYTVQTDKSQFNRVARFDLGLGTPEERRNSESILIEMPRGKNGFHNAGGVCFGTDGFLYVSFGDALSKENHQATKRGFFAGIIRIDVDCRGGDISHEPTIAPSIGKVQGYYIPSSNPFCGSEDTLEEFFAIGLRNPFRIHSDRSTGSLWVTENGEEDWEEVNVLRGGENCQYPFFEGPTPIAKHPAVVVGEETPPFFAYQHTSLDRSIIGGATMHSSTLPGLVKQFVFADGFAGRLFAISTDVGSSIERREIARTPYKGQMGISGLFGMPTGELLVTVLGSRKKPTGKVYSLEYGTDMELAGRESFQIESDLTTEEFYTQQCATCHGPQGRGDGPRAKEMKKLPRDLTESQWQNRVTDQHIFDVIKKGGAAVGLDNGMPSWALTLSEEQIQKMVRHIRSLPDSVNSPAAK